MLSVNLDLGPVTILSLLSHSLYLNFFNIEAFILGTIFPLLGAIELRLSLKDMFQVKNNYVVESRRTEINTLSKFYFDQMKQRK